MAKYQGFVSVEEASASLVNTYGNKALMLHVQDRDFDNVTAMNTQYKNAERMLCVDLQRNQSALFFSPPPN